MTHHRAANGLAHDQPEPGWFGGLWTPCHVQHQRGGRRTSSSPDRGGEVGPAAHAVVRRQHEGQAARRARPLRRREERIERPARVRMRSRNPWVLARRRLLGWNVRFDTRTPRSGQSGDGAGTRVGAAPTGQTCSALRYNGGAGSGQTGIDGLRLCRGMDPSADRVQTQPGRVATVADVVDNHWTPWAPAGSVRRAFRRWSVPPTACG